MKTNLREKKPGASRVTCVALVFLFFVDDVSIVKTGDWMTALLILQAQVGDLFYHWLKFLSNTYALLKEQRDELVKFRNCRDYNSRSNKRYKSH